MIAMSSVPSRIREGMLLLSGDVLLLFNPLQIDYSGNGAAAISFKENVETGKNHGVFLNGANGRVAKFLHKQTVESLRACGAVNERGAVDIDTGAVIFSSDMLASLYSLVSTDADYDKYVNDRVRLSLYGDFLYPLAIDSTLDQFYLEKPEGEFCQELHDARTAVWEVLRPYRLKLLRLAPAKFIHFGTTGEILKLMSDGIEAYKELGWSKQVNSSINNETAGYNSVLSNRATIGKDCYLEVSYVHRNATVGDHVVLSYIDIHDETIPSDVVLHGLKQKDGKFVARIYGIKDNPKEDKLFGMPLADFIAQNGINESELGEDYNGTLWTADLYPACDSIVEAVASALNIYEMAHGRGDVAIWRNAIRKSLCSGFNDADPSAIIEWDNRMQELVRMDGVAKLILSGKSASEAEDILRTNKLSPIQEQWLNKRLEMADFSETIRLNYYIGTALGGIEGERLLAKCFQTISDTIMQGSMDSLQYNDTCRITKDKHTVQLPLRVNWGGGWSDTPPYCNERGGTVLNAAILLNGEKPVEVTLERIPEHKVVFDSRDMDVHGEFDRIEPLQATGDPYDSFALQKAALLACGIIPKEGGDLDEILTRLGGGFVMHSEVTNVPKGSGLGTSSILSAACVKAVFEFMGIEHDEADLYQHVLIMEQIMSTGGGWQDQVGGVTPGIKYITSMPGVEQKIMVSHVEIPEKAKKELSERFVLIYTGQRRLARNLLRDVVGRYVGNEPDSLYALNEIQRVAALMKFELERGNVDEFANLLDYHWELSQKVDKGSTNTLIDQIFASIEDFTAGKLVCGAGGGGFLQVMLKNGVNKAEVRARLKEVFEDSLVDVWDCTFV
jgi:fucokinase